ncbi:MAG TPA: DUF4190 domain-containing protein [Jiangellaceae bacterium]|nr:DUF4190 domain-containing protein [Jiangellaceae bacterium]
MTRDPYGQNPGDDQEREGPDQQPWGQPPSYAQSPPAGQSPTTPSGYGQPYPYPKQDDKALAALILSIAAWMVCPFVLHIVSLVLANQSLQAIRESNGWLTGEGMANAARIISIVGVALGAAAIALLVLFGLGVLGLGAIFMI